MHFIFTTIFLIASLHLHHQLAYSNLVSEPLKPPDFTTVPSFPVQTGAQTCKLDLSAELFGGVNAASHAKTALQVKKVTSSSSSSSEVMPMMPDDSQKCVNSLQTSLLTRNIHIPQPNASCDAVICFCGIRLHQI
nr:hypothetical protein [Tanacetum cinerariifolium]